MEKKTNRSTSNEKGKASFTYLTGKPEQKEIDEKIVMSFKNSYVYKTFLGSDSVSIVAEDGIVTLTGTVEDESHKKMAQETISRIQGVIRVDNQVVTLSEAAAESADKWIARKVKLTFLFHFHVSATGTTVEVKDRVVTLRGEASSMAQKELTSEYAADIEGVKSVINEMTLAVTPPPAKRTLESKIDDASIFAQVYTALMTHHSTSTLKTTVEAKDGHVCLTGIARNPAEKALVTKIVSDIHGVSSVTNQMTVEVIKTV